MIIRRANISPFVIVIFFFGCCFFYGCVRPQFPPLSTLKIEKLDITPLKGKTIVIDPGHGGPELGAVGVRGLKESEVNLGVALYLWGLLHEAGANAILTRTADTSVSTAVPFSLKEDLAARSALSNDNNADLFISIHHNSDIHNRKRNDLQVYYKMSDPLQSRDSAQSILSSLQKKLRAATGNIFPGNYRVLRDTSAPAILGESSFMSNNTNEGLLSFQRTLQIEAEGYFDGILSYYQKGVPVIADISPRDSTLSYTQPEITVSFDAGSDAQAIDPASIRLKLDGIRTPGYSLKNANTISYKTFQHLHNGKHTVCVSARNMAGNSSKKGCSEFHIASPPVFLTITAVFPIIPPDGISNTAIDIKVLDYLQRPVIDGTEVRLSTTGGILSEKMVKTKSGQARALLTSDKKAKEVTLRAETNNITSTNLVRFATPDDSLFCATITDGSGTPIEGVMLNRNNRGVALSDEKGLVFDRARFQGETAYTFVKKGYEITTGTVSLSKGKVTTKHIVLTPIDGGVFFGKKIMLDPAGTSNKSLPLLRALGKQIENAGGTAIITWDKDPSPSYRQRVVMASEEKADLYIAVQLTNKRFSAGYYFKSTRGKMLGESICSKFSREPGLGGCIAEPFYHYIIMQTAMPALWICLPRNASNRINDVSSIIYKALAETLHSDQN